MFIEIGKYELILLRLTYLLFIQTMGDPQIYVRGFPKYTSEEDLRAAFKGFGEIK